MVSLLLVTIAAALNLRLPASASIQGIRPDFVLAAATAAGLVGGPEAGALLGFCGAYLITSEIPFSPGSFYCSHILVGCIAGLPRTRLYTENPLVPPIAGVLAGLAGPTLFFIFTPHRLDVWLHSLLIQPLYAVLLTPLFYGPMRIAYRRDHQD